MSEPETTPTPRRMSEVPGLPGYFVGDDGSVWSAWERYYPGGRPGVRYRLGTTRVRLSTNLHEGYPSVTIRGRGHFIHLLVLSAFVGPCPPGMECRHLDGNAANCRLANLAWGTRKQNAQDRVRHGTSRKGERHHAVKLTEAEVRELLRLWSQPDRPSQSELARRFNITQPTVSEIVNGKKWSHLHKEHCGV